MKRLGRVLGSLLAVALTVFSLQSFAAAQMGGRDFNHMTTGFLLSGGHAVAACETCHIGGVFKGTPRACDGCHAVGKRIIATPKTNSHIVTDAPCESCHFNTATWLGARYNHGTAQVGKCETCHNGRIASGRPANHLSGSTVKRVNSCDSCHRTSAWLIAGYWNHTAENVAGKAGCNDAACHSATGDANTKTVTSNPKHLPYPTIGGATFASCQSCHLSYSSFAVVKYNHPSGLACDLCHNSTYNLGAVRGMPANHIPISGAACTSCHTANYSWAGMNHSVVSGIACYTCHGSNTAYGGNSQETARWPNFHESSKNPSATDCSASGCHRPAGSKGVLYQKWD